jgi:hypothetical protein
MVFIESIRAYIFPKASPVTSPARGLLSQGWTGALHFDKLMENEVKTVIGQRNMAGETSTAGLYHRFAQGKRLSLPRVSSF